MMYYSTIELKLIALGHTALWLLEWNSSLNSSQANKYYSLVNNSWHFKTLTK